MPCGRIVAIALICLCLAPLFAFGQYQPPSEFLSITADRAYTWSNGSTNVAQLQGPVTIQTDRAKMTADRAVVWITPLPGTVLDQQRAEIALIGNAAVEQGSISRSGDVLFIETQIRSTIRLTAQSRIAQNLTDSDLYRDASAIRPVDNVVPGSEPAQRGWLQQRPWVTASLPEPTTAPTSQPKPPTMRVSIEAGRSGSLMTPEGTVAALMSNGVVVVQSNANGDVIQLQARQAMLFTPLASLEELGGLEGLKKIEQAVTAAYLEGDVRIVFSPRERGKGEQRMTADRVYYDFTTDRAVLTDAVVHSIEPRMQIPMILRARLVKQLSEGEYKAEHVELSTSSFATPTYSIYSDRAYVRQSDTGDPRLGSRTVFSNTNNVVKIFHAPVFYWPWFTGSLTERGGPLRNILIGSSRGFGTGVRTTWGVFETLGMIPPKDLDAAYHLDYFNDRGLGLGLDVDYKGGFVTETSKQPWNFQGDFTAYGIQDHGLDRLGGQRRLVQPDDELRYHAVWEHQHFFPEDWQFQVRASTVSDPTFLEQYFRKDFNDGLPHDESIYVKHQTGTEALTLFANAQPHDFVTNSDSLQEGFEVERYPELGYYRTGDSLFDDQFTAFSANTVSALHFKQSDTTLAELGFRPTQTPGIASVGTTGVTDDTILRGDFREELDYPFNVGQFKVVPYVMGRYTPYSDSPDGSQEERIFAGAGVKLTTAFWKVDDSAKNELFDIHRLRHVVEPELNLFTSAESVDRTEVFNYDENVDQVNDVIAAQLALTQRWQTKRGGAGRWRSVDFFTLRTEANFFLNQPDDAVLNPTGFRGLFFPSAPELSIPRNSINVDALWRASDSTAILSDMQWNIDDQTLATTSIGMAVQRDARLSYFLGARYIGELNSTIASYAVNYELSPKYSVRFAESVDLSARKNQSTTFTIVRKFDRFIMTFTLFYDAVDDEGGFRFGIYPEGLGYGLTSDQFQQAFGGQQ
ncbi:MAG TPA: LPS assembly protein LptD [Tepidisphaeraceae bacterium]|nr:LPS assembly protein LptD [Tepidisphaeraceae bacterium]